MSEDATPHEATASWFPMIVIGVAQVLVISGAAVLTISISAIVDEMDTAATTIQAAIVTYSLVTAGLLILGGRLAAKFGPLRSFRVGVAGLTVGMALVAIAPNPPLLIASQIIAGLASAVLIPTFIALIAATYQGKQRMAAVAALGAAAGFGNAVILVVAGAVGEVAGWRLMFWILAGVCAVVVVASASMHSPPAARDLQIDGVGVLLSAGSILLMCVGFNQIATWGLVLAKPASPVSPFGMSPALLLIVAGVLLAGAFFSWQRRVDAAGRTPLLSPEVTDSPGERVASICMLAIRIVAAGVGFVLPLYLQMVEGYSSMETGIIMLPYAVGMLVAAMTANRLVTRWGAPRTVQVMFVANAIALVATGIAIGDEWRNVLIITMLIVVGTTLGGPNTVLSNVMVNSVPPERAGEVGGLRGTLNNLSVGVGTALAGAALIGVLASAIGGTLSTDSTLPDAFKDRVQLDKVQFVDNDGLREALSASGLTSAQLESAVQINADARLTALRASFFLFALMTAVAALPAARLPGRKDDAASVEALGPVAEDETEGAPS